MKPEAMWTLEEEPAPPRGMEDGKDCDDWHPYGTWGFGRAAEVAKASAASGSHTDVAV